MRFLLANDDGIYSPGLAALAHCAGKFGDVHIVAPDVEQSSMSHAITHSRPLSLKRTPVDGREGYRVNASTRSANPWTLCAPSSFNRLGGLQASDTAPTSISASHRQSSLCSCATGILTLSP